MHRDMGPVNAKKDVETLTPYLAARHTGLKSKLFKKHKTYKHMTEEEAVGAFLDIVKGTPSFGYALHLVRNKGGELGVLGVSPHGIAVIHPTKFNIIYAYEFLTEIRAVAANVGVILLTVVPDGTEEATELKVGSQVMP